MVWSAGQALYYGQFGDAQLACVPRAGPSMEVAIGEDIACEGSQHVGQRQFCVDDGASRDVCPIMLVMDVLLVGSAVLEVVMGLRKHD